MTRRWLWASMTMVGCGLLLTGWIVFLTRNGLDRADKLSSVAGVLVAVVLGVVGVLISLRAGGGGPGPVQINTASGNATMYTVQGGDLKIGDPDPGGPDIDGSEIGRSDRGGSGSGRSGLGGSGLGGSGFGGSDEA
ncbi:hypothetical protein [Paractinoplanes lichenicola]|uniref:Uncharacterized protein n=1 Tax=Paractinoplanes lichenicola TaxID=2802976 RepID=A0ABS1VZ61_9ACTN|nr:hypothetical protein [Actinoplanes lichenicola]MBL7259775.1 hypothetical protein [Actinoplanes lichenicola]